MTYFYKSLAIVARNEATHGGMLIQNVLEVSFSA